MTEPRLELTPDGRLLVRAPAPAKERWSWALYDFANTIFSMNVVTLYDFANTIFSMNVVTLYFAVWLVTERGATNTAYSVATSLSSVAVLLLAPWIGAVSDAWRRRKPWIVGFTLVCAGATLALAPFARAGVSPRHGLLLLLGTFAVANTAYQLALPPYNAMLAELVPESGRGKLSGVGTALGYAGSILGILLVAPFVTGGLGIPAGGRQAAFTPTALLFLLFSLPFFLFCRDPLALPRSQRPRVRWRAIVGELVSAFRNARRYRGLTRFVVATYFYQDALGTAISFMALYAVSVLGLPPGGEIRLFVTLTVPAIAGAYVAGRACDRWGPRRTLQVVLAAWMVGLVAIALAPTLAGFWAGGFIVGFAFGGIWAAERPLLLTLVPAAEAGRFFGLLALSARAAAIVGPLIWAAIVDGLSAPLGRNAAYRLAVASLAGLMAVAFWLLRGVPDVVAPGDPASHRIPSRT